VLATAATVIASQALITGAFSVTKQVIQLGYLPRLNRSSTPACTDKGQIYMPFVNWGLFVADRAGGGACSAPPAIWRQPTALRSRWTCSSPRC
jgi:hypothetical protein